jgi:hypothetical protein
MFLLVRTYFIIWLIHNIRANFEELTGGGGIFQVEVFWIITPSNVAVGYQSFRSPYCLISSWRWRQYGPLIHPRISFSRTEEFTAPYRTRLPCVHCFHFNSTVYLKVNWCVNTSRRHLIYHHALGYGLDDRGSKVRLPAGTGNFSLQHRIQNGSGAHLASYPMGTRGSFPGGKAAGAWSWPLTSI